MRRPILISIGLGGFMALFLCSVTFAALSILNPGWLRQAFAPPPTPVSVPTQLVDVGDPPDETLPTPDLTPPPPATSVPLPTAEEVQCGGPAAMTIALLGMDTRPGDPEYRARTDAITLVRVNFANPSAAMLSIPRDLYLPLPNLQGAGIEQSRINTAYLYGEIYDVPGGGPAEFKQTVELNFGVRVDRYVLLNFTAFIEAVDAIGGIDVDVPKAIYDPSFPLQDDSGTMVFEVPAGRVHMDGLTALRYVRTRHQDDDYHRVQRQQDVLLAIRDKLVSPEIIPQLPGLIAALSHAGRTDLSPGEIASLACIGPKIDRAAIEAYPIDGTMVLPWTTPGGGRVSIPNREVIAPLVQAFLNVGTGTLTAEVQP